MKTREILYSVLFGALIAAALTAILIISSPHAHADIDSDTKMVCNVIASDPSNSGVDAAVLILLGERYDAKQVASELSYAIAYRCPQYLKLVTSWAHTPAINGRTPSGDLA